MESYVKDKYKSNIFELSIGLNDLYWIMHVMQSKNMKKLQKIVWNMSREEGKSWMFQKEEFSGSKGNQCEVFLGILL